MKNSAAVPSGAAEKRRLKDFIRREAGESDLHFTHLSFHLGPRPSGIFFSQPRASVMSKVKIRPPIFFPDYRIRCARVLMNGVKTQFAADNTFASREPSGVLKP